MPRRPSAIHVHNDNGVVVEWLIKVVTVEKKARTFFVRDFRPLQGLTTARSSDDVSYESR